MIYMDSAATTLLKPKSVGRAMMHAINTMSSPGRGVYAPAMLAADTLLECRSRACKLLNAGSEENVIFTTSATHGLNIAIRSLAQRGTKTLCSGFEHNSVIRPLTAAGAELRFFGKKLFDREDTLRDFAEKLDGTELVVCTHVSNVFGYILPIYEIAELCRKKGIPLIVDASQSAGILPVDFRQLGAAFAAMPGHKGLYGPQGTGILVCGDRWRPLLYGGSGSDSIRREMPEYLPDGLEAGTHNVPGIAGLNEGLKFVSEKSTERIAAHERQILLSMMEQLRTLRGAELFSSGGAQQSGVLSVRFAGIDSEEMARRLGAESVCVRGGLHCAPLAHESAGTLESGTVRFSFSAFTRREEIDYVCRILREIIN